ECVYNWQFLYTLTLRRGIVNKRLLEQLPSSCSNLHHLGLIFVDQVPFNHRFDQIDDTIVDSLKKLRKLTMLRLHFTSLTTHGVRELLHSLLPKSLRCLDLLG